MTPQDIIEDHRAYYSDEFSQRVLEELFFNSLRTIHSVYIFKHFDEYVTQLQADKNEDKKDVYWNASYYEKLTDYIKISLAFENYSKAVLIKNGYLVHKIKKNDLNKELFKMQDNGLPVKIADFRKVCEFKQENLHNKYSLDGLQKNLQTINYSETLSKKFQEIIGIDAMLVSRLKEINEYRNKLHFFTDFKGAFRIDLHIDKWRFIKDTSIATIDKSKKTTANSSLA